VYKKKERKNWAHGSNEIRAAAALVRIIKRLLAPKMTASLSANTAPLVHSSAQHTHTRSSYFAISLGRIIVRDLDPIRLIVSPQQCLAVPFLSSSSSSAYYSKFLFIYCFAFFFLFFS
jgi:hypothetical protein